MLRPFQACGLSVVGVLALSCTSTTGSSFQTLGVPDVSPPPSRAAIIVGWEEEQREGWSISRVRVDGRTRSEWDQASQHPAVIYLEPGQRSVQLMAEQRGSDPGGSAVRRYRSKAVEFQLEERLSTLCVIRIRGQRRRRPRVSCADYGQSTSNREQPLADSSRTKRAVVARSASSELVESPYPAAGQLDRADEPNVTKLVPTPYASVQETEPEPPNPERADLLKNPYDDQARITERIRQLEERLERIEQVLTEQADEHSTP